MRSASASSPSYADDPQHVMGYPLFDGQGVDRVRGQLAQGLAAEDGRGGPADGRRILEAVVPAVVAVHRRGGRVQLQGRFPVAVGDVVDGGCGSSGVMDPPGGGRVAGDEGEASGSGRRHDVGQDPQRQLAVAQDVVWKRRMSKASPSRAARSRRSRSISRRPVM